MAEFSFEVSDLSVIFADASTGTPTAWSWDFGDGGTSTRQNPLHTYAEAGTYTVSLTVTAAGGESRKRKFVSVEAGDTLMADFGYTISGLTVLFSDSSSGKPTSFSWDFGDNATSSVRDPSHTYARAGTYTVTLTVANDFGVTDSASQFVSPSLGAPPVADFSAQTSGLSVLFTDKSTGSPTSWTWSFGDGASSATQHPSHTYAAAGSYNVTLTAASTAGSSMKTQVVTVSLGDPPVADFEFQVNGFTVVFVDRSTKSPTSWSWDFGECTQPQCQSTQPNPTYTYSQSGTFTVVLTASNAAGSSQKAKLVTIAGTTSPMTRFCYQRNGLAVLFTDASGGTPTEWDWDFGDCTTPSPACTSSAQNPGHTYAAMGTYTVTLRTRNAGGQSALSKFVTVDPSVTDAAPRCN